MASLDESDSSLDRYLVRRSREFLRSSIARSRGVIVPPCLGGMRLDFVSFRWLIMPPIFLRLWRCQVFLGGGTMKKQPLAFRKKTARCSRQR